MSTRNAYWFPAKKFGWGWGLPVVWQGWAVLATFFLLLACGGVVILPGHGPLAFLAYAVLLCVLLTAVCWAKGEPPRWRQGDE